MHLKISKISDEIFFESKKYFPKEYINSLGFKANIKESVIARFLISKLVEKHYKIGNFLPKVDAFWKPIFENWIFWSISHKNNIVFVWIWKEKFWLDLEIFKEREPHLLENFEIREYKQIWWKNFKNFYLLWVAKEAFIKKELLSLDILNEIKLLSVKKENNIISEILFSSELILEYQNIQNKVLFWSSDEAFYSFAI